MTSKKHICDLNLGSDSMLPEAKTKCDNIWRGIRKWGQLSMYHPDTQYYFRSYSSVVAERQRQLLEEGYQLIHPLSLFSLIWTTFMILVNCAHMVISPFRLFFVLQPMPNLKLHDVDILLLMLHLVCLTDIVMNFNIGYIERRSRTIIVDRKSIAYRYIKGWLLIDLISCMPVAFTMLSMGVNTPRHVLIAHILPLLRTARVCTAICRLKTFIQLFSASYIVQGIIRIPVVLLLSAHWGACLMYLPPVVIYYWTGEMPIRYIYFLQMFDDGSNLLLHTITTRYSKAIVIVISAFFGTGFSMFRSSLPDELLIHSCIIIYATMFIVFTFVFLIKAYLTNYDSEIRYHGLINQVETIQALEIMYVPIAGAFTIIQTRNVKNIQTRHNYLWMPQLIGPHGNRIQNNKHNDNGEEYIKYRQLPVSLKKRVLAFYEYRYQNHYFKEEANLNYLSEELRDEVRLHTSIILIHNVKIFENIPASTVGTILGCLHPEVYLVDDLVVAAGDIGNCMYFIATGTVAVYSMKGVEICHLEDGAHFGEVALLVKDSKRSVTVVAVETTQMYRLDAEDFRRYIATHPMLCERIEAQASRRMHETVLVDEAFRQEREKSLSQSH